MGKVINGVTEEGINAADIASLTNNGAIKGFTIFESRPSLEDLEDGEIAFYVGADAINNYNASAAPAIDDDSSKGYGVGSRWFYNETMYECIDATVGAAVWATVTLTLSIKNLTKYPGASGVTYTGSGGTNAPHDAFDQDSSIINYRATPGNSWVKVQFSSAKTIKQLLMYGSNSSTTLQAFKLQASNNDTDWTDLLTDTLKRDATLQTFDLENSTAYTYYRVFEVSNYGHATITAYSDIRMMG